MSPTSPSSPIVPLLQHVPAGHSPLPVHSTAAHHAGTSSSSSPPAHSASRKSALLQQLPSGVDKLASLANILHIDLHQLDALLPSVVWSKQNGTYALRSVENNLGYWLHFDGIGKFTEFPAALLEDAADNSDEAKAARQMNLLMIGLAAPYVRAKVLGSVQPVDIGGERFHLQVTNRDALRAYAVLDDGQELQLVRQGDRYVPQVDLRERQASPNPVPLPAPAARPMVLVSSAQMPGAGSSAFRPVDSGVDDALALPLFGLSEEAAAFIKTEPGTEEEAAPVPSDKGKRAAEDLPPSNDGSRAKRPRNDVGPLPYDATAAERWDAFRANQDVELPVLDELAPAARVLLQASAVGVPCRMEYEQRDWQARNEGKSLSAQAIIQAHRQARFTRIALCVSGVSTYRNITVGKVARKALEELSTLPAWRRTAGALYEKLEPGNSETKKRCVLRLKPFDAYLATRSLSLYDVLDKFTEFAEAVRKCRKTLPPSQGDNLISGIYALRALCYPDLPFYRRIADRTKDPLSAFFSKGKNDRERGTAAGSFDSFLARKHHAPAAIPDDVEGLGPFFALLQAACAENDADKRRLKNCLTQWRAEAHRLYLDDLFDGAIKAYPGTNDTKTKWITIARQLASFAWDRQMPIAEYTSWVRAIDLQGAEFKAACEWGGIPEKDLRSLINQFRTHRPASGAE